MAMAHRAVLCFLCVFGVFQKGLTALVQTQQTVMAAVGQEARFSCQLMQTKDVLQVTWLKVSPEGEENIAFYHKHFGQRVNPDFRDKVEFEAGRLQSCSVVIRNVTKEDERCYRCLFNTYPEGAFTATTCLQLYELHEPILHVGESNSAEEAVVSCSATGRPAPTVTLNVPQPDLRSSDYSSVSATNTDGTVTVTTTAVLPRLHGNSTQVGCAARVLSGPQVEVFMMIPEVKQPSADDPPSFLIIVGVFVVVACVCVAAIISALLIRKHRKRDPEEFRTPQKPNNNNQRHEIKTPFIQQENELQRQRSTGKNKK